MRDAITMWRSTKMAVLTALCAALYAALLIPFKAIPLIPGITEMRPANVFPVVAGLLFGPAAAWGSAFGNLIGDFFGTVGPGSLFGFIGNFAYAYVPYRLWRAIMGRRPATGAPAQAPLFVFVAVIGSASCAVIIGYGVDLIGTVPYPVLTTLITLNNAIAAVALGLILLPLLYPRAQRWGLLYEDVMPAHDYRGGRLEPLGALLVICGALGGLLVALNVRLGGEAGGLVRALPGGLSVSQTALGCVALLAAGSAMFTGLARRGAGQRDGGPAGAPSAGVPAIAVQGLGFRYPATDRPALAGVGLIQAPGALRVLMGPTGAGKSTLCKCLNGVIPELQIGDLSGEVRLFGRDISGTRVSDLAPVVGEVLQDFESQLLTASVEAEVAFPLENLATPVAEMRERVQRTLESVGAWGLRARDPQLLSGGEKQRVALAAALATAPQIVVLDEPTTDLDPQGKAEFLEQCERLRAAGNTVLLAEHETELARDADTLTVLRDGAIVYDGAPAELLADPARCEELGLRPLDAPSLLAALGRAERPLTVEAAREALAGAQWDDRAWQQVLAEERERASCGDRPFIRVRELCHTYAGEVAALSGVSLDVCAGEFVAILGQNGSGKTTLAKHLNGLLRPTSGEVVIGDLDTRRASPAQLAATVGYLFQNPDHQIFAETVREEVAFGPRNLGCAGEELAARVEEALESMGLTGLAAADPFTLTKGQRQQVALASVLAMRPRAIVVDEPTTGLDGPQQRAMMESLRGLNEAGHTVVIITHATWAAAEYARRTILLDRGKVVADAPTREVFGNAELLSGTGQRVPEITRLCQEVWGRTALSVAEAEVCLGGRSAELPGGEGR